MPQYFVPYGLKNKYKDAIPAYAVHAQVLSYLMNTHPQLSKLSNTKLNRVSGGVFEELKKSQQIVSTETLKKTALKYARVYGYAKQNMVAPKRIGQLASELLRQAEENRFRSKNKLDWMKLQVRKNYITNKKVA